jgi:hypothetical protein
VGFELITSLSTLLLQREEVPFKLELIDTILEFYTHRGKKKKNERLGEQANF